MVDKNKKYPMERDSDWVLKQRTKEMTRDELEFRFIRYWKHMNFIIALIAVSAVLLFFIGAAFGAGFYHSVAERQGTITNHVSMELCDVAGLGDFMKTEYHLNRGVFVFCEYGNIIIPWEY